MPLNVDFHRWDCQEDTRIPRTLSHAGRSGPASSPAPPGPPRARGSSPSSWSPPLVHANLCVYLPRSTVSQTSSRGHCLLSSARDAQRPEKFPEYRFPREPPFPVSQLPEKKLRIPKRWWGNHKRGKQHTHFIDGDTGVWRRAVTCQHPGLLAPCTPSPTSLLPGGNRGLIYTGYHQHLSPWYPRSLSLSTSPFQCHAGGFPPPWWLSWNAPPGIPSLQFPYPPSVHQASGTRPSDPLLGPGSLRLAVGPVCKICKFPKPL